MSYMFSTGPAFQAYNLARKWLTLLSIGTAPATFFIDAPFGRFAPKDHGFFVFDGRKSWMLMEIVSPLVFIYSFITAPLAYQNPGLPSVTAPRGLLATLFLIHYANRAIVSPLRTPSRSKAHISVAFSGIFFNILNGFMLGSHLSSPFTILWFKNPYSTQRWEYKVGLALWVIGFIGNIVHDEILLNIRRKARETGKIREQDTSKPKEEYYGIPHGLLYNYISYPNYFCEWIEWLGFALAASPLPILIDRKSLSIKDVAFALSPSYLYSVAKHVVLEPATNFAPNLAPPWIFFIAEVVLMFPRAYRGHLWYKQKFGENYPKDRKVVIPFLL